MISDEEKNSMELDIEAKYVGRTEKEFLNSITYAECLHILDIKNNYCDDIMALSLLKVVDIIEKQSKEIEELKAISEYREKIIKGLGLKTLPKTITGFKELLENNDKKWEDKIKAKIEEWDMKDLTICYGGRSQGRTFQQAVRIEVKNILQSLLEEEK